MAHQLAPSVNCSLDEIDLNALKVHKHIDQIEISYYLKHQQKIETKREKDQNRKKKMKQTKYIIWFALNSNDLFESPIESASSKMFRNWIKTNSIKGIAGSRIFA